jgi:hypothetical protein
MVADDLGPKIEHNAYFDVTNRFLANKNFRLRNKITKKKKIESVFSSTVRTAVE